MILLLFLLSKLKPKFITKKVQKPFLKLKPKMFLFQIGSLVCHGSPPHHSGLRYSNAHGAVDGDVHPRKPVCPETGSSATGANWHG